MKDSRFEGYSISCKQNIYFFFLICYWAMWPPLTVPWCYGFLMLFPMKYPDCFIFGEVQDQTIGARGELFRAFYIHT